MMIYEIYGPGLQHKPVTTGDYIADPHKSWSAGRPVSIDRDDLPQPYSDLGPDYSSDFFRRASSPLSLTLQLILEQYMVELHSPPGRYTLIWYLADYVNTLILL